MNGIIQMRKKSNFSLALLVILTMACSLLTIDKVASANTSTKMTESTRLTSNNRELNHDILPKPFLKLEVNKFGKRNLKDFSQIQSIDEQLRWKYLNKSIYFPSQTDLDAIDSQFNTASIKEMVLHENFSPEDFGIDDQYFSNNVEKVYNSMIKDTVYGVDPGYFLGNTKEQPFNSERSESIRVSLKLPKGTTLMKIGEEGDSNYILPRDTTLKYTAKSFDKSTKKILITAELVPQDELTQATNSKQAELNNKFHSLYGSPSDFIKLSPLGLNAGFVLSESESVVSRAFECLKDGGIYSKDFFFSEKLELTNGWFVNSDLFEKKFSNLTLDERRAKFNKMYNPTTNGETTNQMRPLVNSVINFAHYRRTDPLPQLGINEFLSTVILHESFHYITYLTQDFVNLPIYSGNPNGFQNEAEKVKEEEKDKLVNLLNDSYAEQDHEEYTSEAFMAKFHPLKEIRNEFKKVVPKTNRLLDKLFDVTPPSIPKNLTTRDVGGNDIKFTFDHSTDNLGVNKYNIYLDGKLVKSVDTAKDSNGLSYPKPGEHQDKIEVKIDNLKQITEYQLQVTAVDDTGNESAKSAVLKVITKDIEPPTQTGPLRGISLKSKIAQLFWSKPKDNKKVDKVKIYRNEASSKVATINSHSLKSEQEFTVSADQISYTDSTIEKGKAYTYYMVAVDEAGNISEKSNIITIKTSEQDDENKNEDDAEDVTSSQAKLNWEGAFSGISASAFNIFSWIFSGGSWVFNGVTSVAGTATSSVVGLAVGLSHQFVVVPVDDNGNPLDSGLQISVDSIDKSSIKTKDSTLYVGQKWNKEANFVSATDEDGNSVPYSDNRITTNGSSIDTSKPGEHEIKYSYKGVSKTSDSTFKVTVKEDKTKLELQDVSLYVGQNYNIDSPFKNVTDKDGNPIKASNVDWYYIDEVKTKILDTSKPGVHKVRIVYLDGTNSWKYSDSCTVTVKEDKSSIKTKDCTLYVGETWNAEDNFVSATDENGENVPWGDSRIDINGSEVDNMTPGITELKYSFKGKGKTIDSSFKVTVKERIASMIQEYADEQAKKMGISLGKGIENALKLQSNKLGYLTGDTLDISKPEFTSEIVIPQSNPVQIRDDVRIYGKSTFLYIANSGGIFMINPSHIERMQNVDLSDRQSFGIKTDYEYIAEEWNPQTQKWEQTEKPFRMGGNSDGSFDFKGYYELAPKLKIEEKFKSVEVAQGSAFNFKPEDFFTENSSAGGIRSKFIQIPDLSKLGEQIARIRVWDQYVTNRGWDDVDKITDADWESGAWPLNSEHYTTFEVKFNVVDKGDVRFDKIKNNPIFHLKN